MTTDSLSDKSEEIRNIHHSTGWSKIYYKEDVRAAVQDLRERLCICDDFTVCDYCSIIKEIFGTLANSDGG